MVLTNLQGTIVSNLVCGLIGGPGLTAGSNYGPKYALFEPGTRNTGTKLANQNVANPIAMLNASVELLKHIEMNQHAEVRSRVLLVLCLPKMTMYKRKYSVLQIIEKAIDATVNVEKLHTEDLGGNATTTEVVDSVLANIRRMVSK